MSTKYSHRLNVLKPTVIWSVEADGLHWTDDKGGKGYIPPQEIKQVRLKFEPTRIAPKRVGLHFMTPLHLAVSNSHYVSVGNFEHKPDEFREFVLAFHNMFPANTKTVFNKGSTIAGWIFNIVVSLFVVAMLLLLAPMISLMGIGSGGTNIFRIIMILLFLPLLYKLIVKNKPSSYQANNIPMELLL